MHGLQRRFLLLNNKNNTLFGVHTRVHPMVEGYDEMCSKTNIISFQKAKTADRFAKILNFNKKVNKRIVSRIIDDTEGFFNESELSIPRDLNVLEEFIDEDVKLAETTTDAISTLCLTRKFDLIDVEDIIITPIDEKKFNLRVVSKKSVFPEDNWAAYVDNLKVDLEMNFPQDHENILIEGAQNLTDADKLNIKQIYDKLSRDVEKISKDIQNKINSSYDTKKTDIGDIYSIIDNIDETGYLEDDEEEEGDDDIPYGDITI